MRGEKPESSKTTSQYACPWCERESEISCWYAIAMHQSLPNDPVLGESSQLRFSPSRFDPNGTPLDPEGSPCDYLACPECRNAVPLAGVNLPVRRGAPAETLRMRLLDRVDQDRTHPQSLCLPEIQTVFKFASSILALFVFEEHLILIISDKSEDVTIFDSCEDGEIREIDSGTRNGPTDTGASS